MPLVQKHFSFENFSLFLGKIWKFWIFLFCFVLFCFAFLIYTQTKLIKCYMKFLKKKKIETWTKQTNFKLNHDVANQMWGEAKLGHLLPLGPFRLFEAWYAWTLIMMKWLGLALGRLQPWLWSLGICLKRLGLTLGRHASCELLAFDVDHAYTPLMGSSVGLWLIQEKNLGFHAK